MHICLIYRRRNIKRNKQKRLGRNTESFNANYNLYVRLLLEEKLSAKQTDEV